MTELEGYRRQIDAIDAQLVELFLRRMEVTGAVGRYKQERGLPVLDAERERRVIAGKTEQIGDTARRADVAALYETIMGRSRRQQRQLVPGGCGAGRDGLRRSHGLCPAAGGAPAGSLSGRAGLLQRGGRRRPVRAGGGQHGSALV